GGGGGGGGYECRRSHWMLRKSGAATRFTLQIARHYRLFDHRLGDPLGEQHFALGISDGFDETCCPGVLEHHQTRRRVDVQKISQLPDVILGKRAGSVVDHRSERPGQLLVEIRQLERGYRSVEVLLDEDEVDDT